MYRALVRWMVRRKLADLSAGRLDQFLARFDERSRFCLAGEHELGGVHRGTTEIRSLLVGMRARFPDLTVVPSTVVAQGWPWYTVVATRLEVRATLPDGSPYRNDGLQMAYLRWGRVVEDHIYEDVDALRAALAAATS